MIVSVRAIVSVIVSVTVSVRAIVIVSVSVSVSADPNPLFDACSALPIGRIHLFELAQ